ncbi:MAG: hypothetical protein ACYTG5_08090 [Planctomycetota bacterium]|jgi:membrane protein implicated in regulation of membrane protease activity
METIYFYCAIIGGSLLVLQLLLLLFAADSPADADVDFEVGDPSIDDFAEASSASESFLKLLSLKAIIAFLTFFGLAGLASLRAELSNNTTLLVSSLSGLAGFFIVAYLMIGLSKLQSRGNLDLNRAVGMQGRVYVRVPGESEGSGRVHIALQGRRIECKATTTGAEIKAGTQIKVLNCNGDSLEVAAIQS